MSACDYACMHLINNSTMRGIDVGQPTLCRGIDFLSLMSSHSLLERSTNDELRQISDTGAPAWSCDNPPSLRCNRSWGRMPQPTAHRRCSASLWLMHSSVLFLFVLMTSMSLVGILWLFANTADASAYTCHFLLSCLVQAQILSLLTWLGCQVQCRQPTTWHIFHQRYRKYVSWGNERW